MRFSSVGAPLLVAVSLFLTACPGSTNKTDAGTPWTFDAGNPTARDACSGGCAANQICDTQRRTCVDACGGCDAGTCVKVMEGVFQCREQATTCNGALCEPGQVACLGGQCSCLSSLSGALDTCQAAGRWCNGTVCGNPRALQQCNPGDATAACPTGFLCQPVFGEDLAICTRSCQSNNECGRGEFCSEVGCLASGLFGGHECEQNIVLPDGGVAMDGGQPVRLTVPVSNTCLLKGEGGDVTEAPGKGTGNCTYAVFQFWNDGVYPFETCRPPGNAQEGQPCRDDNAAGAIATQCGTGLQCARTKGGDEGICLRMCNANPPAEGFTPRPACNADEACVNLMRYTDPNDNAVLGVCMKTCDVFDAAKSTCANVGSTPASCVPTQPTGEVLVSTNGDGICVPQRASIGTVGGPCADADPFRGATCGNGQLCTSLSADAPATCTAVCDLECNPPTGVTAPARCATEPNARCATGKTCTRVTSTTGAVVGFCL